MSNEAQTRMAQLTALRAVLPASWALFSEELARQREDMLIRLVAENDEQLRGKVKMIDELLRLPNTLDQEIRNLEQSLSE